MTSIAAPMDFDQYKKNAPKQGGYMGKYERTGDMARDYHTYRNQEGFDLYRGMKGHQGAYDRYNAKHGTNFGHPGAPSPSALPDMSGYGGQTKTQQPKNDIANLTMSADSTPEQSKKANQQWMQYLNNPSNQPASPNTSSSSNQKSQVATTTSGSAGPSGSRTIMPGETSEDPVGVTQFSNSNVEGAPSSNDFEGIDFSMFQDSMNRVPGTEDMGFQDFYEKFNPRERATSGSAPAQGVPQTTTSPGYVTTQAFDQYLNPTTTIGYADDQANLGSMGNNLFDPRRPAAFDAQYVDPFGRTSAYDSLANYSDTVNQEATFVGLLNSLKQQQGDSLRKDGFRSYMPLNLQDIYDQAGTRQGQEQAAAFNQGLFSPYYYS